MDDVVQYFKAVLLIAVVLFSNSLTVYAQATPSLSTNQHQPVFVVNSIEIQGNSLISNKELDGFVAHLAGSEQTLGALEETAEAIQQAYRAAGYGGVVAFVPPQDIAGGKIIIRVLEGKIAEVHIKQNERLNDANILTSLPHLRVQQTPIVRNIDRNIQLANENPAKDVKVVLSAGKEQGDINADITVNEERPLRLLFGTDTAGTPGTGDFRMNFGIQHANLLNRDHVGTFQFQTSPSHPEQVQIYSVGYRLPLYKQFSALDLFYAHSNIDSVSSATPVGPLGFTGKGDVAGFRVHHYLPRLGEYDHRVIFGWDWRHFKNNCTIGSLELQNCGEPLSADVTIAPISLGYTGQRMGSILSWGFNTTVSGNPGGSSNSAFIRARPEAERNYFVWRFFGFSSVNLPAGFGLAGRVSAQFSPHALVPGEQFGIGGGGSAMNGFISVRGYREREVVGDYGTFFNIEGLGPNVAQYLKHEKLRSVNLRPLVFFDFGWAGNHKGKPCLINETSCTLAGVGGGLRLAIGKQFTSRLDVGHALMDGNRKSAGSNRIHLSVNFAY
ncbi:POTRA domain-containing protein [Nitrosomonas sp.]|uniref:ShlB/FhaC/HecB family hemolysin secretion/activation protein n=1 Tax=Nitrosomonas sp. TaxID=42353 RepID=UPI001DD029B8|nr:POTRA domain-containing protein [Nitrosomonas sp.]MCB1948766.1 ShlB/FhaC/HecB family hemolysin secretion/activation protein [Nitrosomonas sp.]